MGLYKVFLSTGSAIFHCFRSQKGWIHCIQIPLPHFLKQRNDEQGDVWLLKATWEAHVKTETQILTLAPDSTVTNR